ncbi:MAG: phenylalanine--tRNA ligase subunit beta [Myxococcaceae bacterium]|nr:phenylalanine--tRNA ligase subunit beta [Myxococcaceae bacterium]
MKLSLKWLADYADAAVPPPELAHRLTMAGLEIEGQIRAGEGLEGVVVALITESRPHPNADKLSVTRVDAGAYGVLQVVCGAKNYKVGDKVPLATVGTTLPGGVKIKKATLRGVESFGMLCSSRELGLDDEHSGLMILDPALPVGLPIVQALGLDDTVFEVNVTPNRSDALSHLGIAREVAAIFGVPLRYPAADLKEGGGAASDRAKVRIDALDRAPRYAARIIENVRVGPSPQWMQDRLKACGIRAINNLVDVTNYVLLEYGHPLHAFDLDELAGPEIVVRLAKKGEKLTTLDGKERALDPDDLVIADRDRPQAIAGVMGGADSEVTEKTTRVLLESAWFQPSSVRRSARRHGLHTEASHRFERGADIEAVPKALDRAAALIAELSGGQVLRGAIDVYPKPQPRRRVTLPYARVGGLLGVDVPAEETKRILGALGFEAVAEDAARATFEVPGWRVDVDREEDLIEEVARIRGYDRIPSVMPRAPARLEMEPSSTGVEERIRTALAGAGFMEVVSYSFVSPKELSWLTLRDLPLLGKPIEAIALKNPLSAEQSVMRTTMYAGLLQALSHNVRHQAQSVRLYEWGRTYEQNEDGGDEHRPVAREVLHVAGVLSGLRAGRHWTSPDARIDFYDAKGAVEVVLGALGIEDAKFAPVEMAPYHPRASARVYLANGVTLGTLGELHPAAAKALDLPSGTFLFDLEVARLEKAAVLRPKAVALTRFPAVLRDLAVVVDAARSAAEVREVILQAGGKLVEDARVFDVYTGQPIPEGKKNLAFALSYRAEDRTLTDAEVNEAHKRIVEQVNERLGAALRGENA